MRNIITRLGQGVARIGLASMILVMIVCMTQGTAAAAGNQESSNCTQDYCIPVDWNTYPVGGITPGVEPLNIIYSAQSTVPLGNLLAIMKNWDDANCVSTEKADVATYGFIPQQASLRLEGCITGGIKLALTGAENHARLWNQPVSGSTLGAWFFTASYETSCIDTTAGLEPLNNVHHKITSKPWHCIDGGKGSYDSNGYDRGAQDLVTALVQAAQSKGWYAVMQPKARPAGTGEDGVPFSGTVYVVTVTRLAPAYQGTAHNITHDVDGSLTLSSITEDQQGNISGMVTWGPPLVGNGPFTGTVSPNNSVTFTDVSNDGSGFTITFTGTINSDGSLSGNYSSEGPGGQQQGTYKVSPSS